MGYRHRLLKGYVYFIQLGHLRYYKIGFTRNIESRLEQLEQPLPFPLNIIAYAKAANANKIETTLHAQYAKKRLKGEWFRLTAKESANIKETIEQNHDDSVEIETFASESGF